MSAPADGQQRPPVRPLGPARATSAVFGAIASVRPLADGHVLVNDPARMQVLLLDSALRIVRVVADTTAATERSYGLRGGALVPYRGDSTLFVDPASLSMLVIDPAGGIARVMAAPRPRDIAAFAGGPVGTPGFDAAGRIVYRVTYHSARPRSVGAEAASVSHALADSAPLIRFDLSSRTSDTVAFTAVATTELVVTHGENGIRISPVVNPVQMVDDWAVMPDGRVAVLRADYHVDFYDVAGRRTSAPRIPFDWRRFTDSAKLAVIDSMRSSAESARTAQEQHARSGAGGRGNTRSPAAPTFQFVAPSALPDYWPAFSAGALLASPDGRLWVRTNPRVPTDPLEYDVLDDAGTLVDRVRVPPGTVVIGLARGATAYLVARDGAGVHLVRAAGR